MNLGFEEKSKMKIEYVFIVDTSYSMYGSKINAMNNIIKKNINLMLNYNNSNYKERIQVSVLEFNDSARWIYDINNQVSNVEDIKLVSRGKSNIDSAYQEILKYVGKDETTDSVNYILITDGMASSISWNRIIELLYKKNKFKNSNKFAISLGVNFDEANNLFLKFTNNKNSIFQVYSEEGLEKVVESIFINNVKIRKTYGLYNKQKLFCMIKEYLKYAVDVWWSE